MIDSTLINDLYAQAKSRVPLEFEARYDSPQITIEPIMVWERDDTFYLVLRGEDTTERWIECMRVIPYKDGDGPGYFVRVDKVAEVC